MTSTVSTDEAMKTQGLRHSDVPSEDKKLKHEYTRKRKEIIDLRYAGK